MQAAMHRGGGRRSRSAVSVSPGTSSAPRTTGTTTAAADDDGHHHHHYPAPKQQAEAVQWERRLEAALAARDDSAVNQCRMRLCELLAELIVAAPAIACRADAVGRLWKNCFYGRIGPARSRILRDQRRRQKPAAAVARQQEKLRAFLQEGVTLLDYLCDKLIGKLHETHNSSNNNTENQHADDDDDVTMEEEEEQDDSHNNNDTEGVVPCLHRLCIHLGDLYRYGSHYPQALAAYARAARLAPAQGHAYNQLAVTTQVQDADGSSNNSRNERNQVAVTVYWYARSLGAARDPFATAATNLQRLLQTNREWLAEHHPQQQQHSSSSKNTTALLANQASRWFLATFCDLQCDLLFPNRDSEEAAASFDDRLAEAAQSFRKLLAASALGDHLLGKLVTIAAFAEWHSKNNSSSNHRSAAMARSATLAWGTCLAERVLALLRAKQQQQQANSNNKKQPKNSGSSSSVRGLLPLLLVTEFVLHNNNNDSGHDNPKSEAFWKAVVEVYNTLLQSSSTAAAAAAGPQQQEEFLQEYQQWQGFVPFASFLPPSKDNNEVNEDDGYISDAEAAALLGDHSSSNSQQSASQLSSNLSSNTGGNNHSGLLKVRRFLGLPFESNEKRVVRGAGNRLEWVEDDIHNDGDNDDVFMGDEDNNNNNNNDDNENLLVYQQAQPGGPALLVPGALLQQQQAAPTTAAPTSTLSEHAPPSAALNPTASSTMATDSLLFQNHGEPNVLQQQPKPAAAVPANTNAPSSLLMQRSPSPMQLQQQQQQPLMSPHADHTTTAAASVLPPPGFGSSNNMLGPPGFNAPSFLFSSTAAPSMMTSTATAPATTTTTVAESYSLFGGTVPTTSNPFANTNNGTEHLADGSAFGSTYNNDTATYSGDSAFFASAPGVAADVEGATLLDSGLLNSLLFDNSGDHHHRHHHNNTNTKNPFAT